ncbi:MAG: glycolate oxidase subunit GlcD [Methanomassiliicoccales archaeon PtaU1.Bin124]|nr:MAG: glycolate oxidase subunit GlcD [Methanomassiliicoccales archaeon PtaU1.Bin124]
MRPEVLNELRDIVGSENVSTSAADLYTYGFDSSIHHHSPEVVIRPGSTEEVSMVVKVAARDHIAITTRGAGTGLCGGAVPLHGGIVLDTTRMNKIREIRVQDLYCVVEAGVVNDKLNEALAPFKFFFPTSPGSGEACTIGGMVAANASGMRAIKYGATRDYVMGLVVVLADGSIVHTGTRTLKNSSGYQLERLFVGSEGTLGIITEVTMRIAPKPKKVAMVMAAFPTLEDAGKCVSKLIATPLLPSACELMDKTCIQAVNKTIQAGLPDCEALCMIEVDGEPEVVERDAQKVQGVARETNAFSVELTHDAKVMAKWTNARKSVMASLSRFGEKFVSVSLADDMAVPISKIPDAVVAFQQIAARNNVIIGTYGHAADGNLHTKMLVDPISEVSWRNGEKAVGEIYDIVIKLGGTVTGEHGVGISKAPFMQKERPTMLTTMAAIKKAMDPQDILNPGKMQEWQGGIIKHLRYPCKDLD